MAKDDDDLKLRIQGEADLDPLTRAVQVAEKKVYKNLTLMQKATVLLGKKFVFVFKKTMNPDLKKFASQARASDKANSDMLRNLAKNTTELIALEKDLKYATEDEARAIREKMTAKDDEIKKALQGDKKEVASM